MSEHNLSFDRAGNSLDAVQRAAYRFSDRMSCEIIEEAEAIAVVMHLTEESGDPVAIEADFRNEVLDQVLRERIRTETEDMRNLVLALAFSKTRLGDADV